MSVVPYPHEDRPGGWEKISSKELLIHPRITLYEHEVKLPGGEVIDYLVYDDGRDFCTVIALGDDSKIMMVREFTYPLNGYLWQFPEGNVDKVGSTSSYEADAKRELVEETGYEALGMEILGHSLKNHRRTKNRQYVWLATGIKELPGGKGSDHSEDIAEDIAEVEFFSEEEIWSMISSGQIEQKNTLAAWAVYQSHNRAGSS